MATATNILWEAIDCARVSLEERIEWEIDATLAPEDAADFLATSLPLRLFDLCELLDCDLGDLVHAAVPIYNSDLATCLAQNPGIASSIEDFGFESSGDLFKDIGLAIYLEIENQIGGDDVSSSIEKALRDVAAEAEEGDDD